VKHSTFRADDGIDIAVQEAGNPAGAEVVLIHGYSQCHLSWMRQIDSSLADEFRLVTYDLRGHGASGKPSEAHHYHDGARWAAELARLFDVMKLRRPVVVAWSYAGRVMSDYLHAFGGGRLAGINLVGSKTRSDPAFVGKENVIHQSRMASPDVAENVAGTIAFLRTCAAQWEPRDFETHLAFNMLTPHYVRALLGGRSFDADALYAALGIPVLFTHGTLDRVVPIAASHAGHVMMPTSQLSVYDGVGHAPFLEAPDRFNAELAAFVRRCQSVGNTTPR
jgi:pimeloyl-ACP methyl ester carboxylesterase